ncbi:hypothetical protein KIN20_027199 [Parelaphostrongylus tenuis]|uniref:Malonyl-CoA decarboxylase n=1 Tax=Parelaphostrongylus tenuis TaxID=148309 RepID=A0AAD5QZ38_PARTN|nr:hypothetical protein KIN20_027199 [Parelaphostrongylus tenuis]
MDHSVRDAAGKLVTDAYTSGDAEFRSDLLLNIATNCGRDLEALNNAISTYNKNHHMVHEIREAATPMHFRLLRSLGNLPDGIKQVCDMRANLLESARRLLLVWFCQSNVKVERLTGQSPGDILYKVASHKAVHPVKGPSDLMNRLGNLRRCYYFSHEAMPREPLVIVYVALLNEIADSVQSIVDCEHFDSSEDECTTAIYYSITATQPGLFGIDLGNMLIKSVASRLHSELPSIQTHSTLSPIPGFRTWMLRNLHGSSLSESVIDKTVLREVSDFAGKSVTTAEAAESLIRLLTNTKESIEEIEMLKSVLLQCCAKYLCSRRQNGFALNSVANFHLKNGAEIYRLNWMGDTSDRGMSNSVGIMVNYRYRLNKVLENSVRYTLENHIEVHDNVLSLMSL